MKKIFILVFIFIVANLNAHENHMHHDNHNHNEEHKFIKEASSDDVEIAQNGEGKEFCPVCGMKLKNFYKTTHASSLENGEKRHYCSMRCLIVDHEKNGANLQNAMVVDAKSEKLIVAKTAFYVVGSDVAGTMASISKLAFENENDAKDFIKLHGGELKNFDETLQIAKENIKSDDEKRKQKMKKMAHPMGEKAYNTKCDKIKVAEFSDVRALKSEIYKKCKNITEKEAQPILRYLWDIEKHGKNKKIEVSKTDKCPVCGMFVHHHQEWASKIYFNDKYLAFDGVKDMMKFIFNPAKYGNFTNLQIQKIEVVDYYSQNVIDGKNAFYVAFSDVLGPMGNELIPFENEDEAKNFIKDHKGEIFKFDKISQDLVLKLD